MTLKIEGFDKNIMKFISNKIQFFNLTSEYVGNKKLTLIITDEQGKSTSKVLELRFVDKEIKKFAGVIIKNETVV